MNNSMQESANMYFKQSIISTIIMLAEKVRGRESVSNLIQYRYEEMIKHSYEELESIRDGHLLVVHLKVYNNQIINNNLLGETNPKL